MEGQYERALETFNSEVTVTLEDGIIHFQRGKKEKYALWVERVHQQSHDFLQGIEFTIAQCLGLRYDTGMNQVIREKLKSQQPQTE